MAKRETDPEEIGPAHVAVVVIALLTAVAFILGIATGTINDKYLAPPPVPTSITIP